MFFKLQKIRVNPDLKVQLLVVIVFDFFIFFGTALQLILSIAYGTLDRIWVFLGYAVLSVSLLATQCSHVLILLALLKRLRLMNRGLRRASKLDITILRKRRFLKTTLDCCFKMFQHLCVLSETTTLIFAMVSYLKL